MKKLLLFSAAIAALFACSEPGNKYTLTGTVDQKLDSAQVVLKSKGISDTTTVVNGKFKFEGECEIPEICSVRVRKDKEYVSGNMILEKGTPKIDFGSDGKYTCSGTALNVVYNQVTSQVRDIEDCFRETYSAIVAKKDSYSEDEISAKIDSLYTSAMSKRSAIYHKLFGENANNVIGVESMKVLASDKNTFDSLYNIAGEVVRNNEAIVKEKNRFEQLEKTSEGKMFTDFTIENGNLDGTPAKLSDYVGKGKYVLVDFWASWCGPCRAEIPNLAEIYKKFKGDKFEILGVAVWDKLDDTKKALGELPITWPVIVDAQAIPTDLYGITGIPQIILFAPDGTIAARNLRGEKIPEKIAEVLKK